MAAQDTANTGGLRCWECGGVGHNEINCGRTCQYCHGLDHQTVQCRATVDREGRPLEDVLPKLSEEESRELIATMVRLFGGSVGELLKKMKTKTRDPNTPLRKDATARSLSAAIAAPTAAQSDDTLTSAQGGALKRSGASTSEDSPTKPAKKAKLPPSTTIPDKADRSAPSSASHSEGPVQRKEQKPASLAKKTKKVKNLPPGAVQIFAPLEWRVWGRLSREERYALLNQRRPMAEGPSWLQYRPLYENLKCPVVDFQAIPGNDDPVTVSNAKNQGRNLCFAPDGVIYWNRKTIDHEAFTIAVRDGGLSPSIVDYEKNETVMAAVGFWNPDVFAEVDRIQHLRERIVIAPGRPNFAVVDVPRPNMPEGASRPRPEHADEYDELEPPVCTPTAMGRDLPVTTRNAPNQGDNLCFGPDRVIYLYLGGDLREFQRAVRDGGLSPSILDCVANSEMMAAVGFWKPATDPLEHLPKRINYMKGKPNFQLDPGRCIYRRQPSPSTFPSPQPSLSFSLSALDDDC